MKYLTQEISDQEREATFAARQDLLQQILDGLRAPTRKSKSPQGWLLSGPRGAGKSTLLHMTRQRIGQDEQLQARWWPIILPEEHPGVLCLRDLWVLILEQLGETNPVAKQAADQCAKLSDHEGEQLAVATLRTLARESKRRFLLGIENFSDLLEVLRGDPEALPYWAKQLATGSFATLLATSVREINFAEEAPEFAGLQALRCEPISMDEVWAMFEARWRRDGRHDLLTPENKAKIQGIVTAITRLTGGNPRLVVMLYEIVTNTQVDSAVRTLRALMDDLTPLYDGLLRRLSAQQRKLVDALMRLGGFDVAPAALAEAARIDVLTVRSQLTRLRESNVVNLLGGGKGREVSYTVADRLFATWYQMRYFPERRRRIEMFVEVLRAWFTPSERFKEYLKTVALDPLGKRLGETQEYIKESLQGTEWYEKVQDRKKAIEIEETLLEGMTDQDVIEACHQGHAHYWASESHLTIERYSFVLERGHCSAALTATLLRRCGDAWLWCENADNAIVDFTRCIDLSGSPLDHVAKAHFGRGIAFGKAGLLQMAITDYTRCIELRETPKEIVFKALTNRGVAYSQTGMNQLAVDDYTQCIDCKDVPTGIVAMALMNRGILYDMAGNLELAKFDYTRCIKVSDASPELVAKSLASRGVIYQQAGQKDLAIADYTQCIDLRDAPPDQIGKALLNRGCAFGDSGRIDLSIADLTRCIDLPDVSAILVAGVLANRGGIYHKRGQTDLAIADYTQCLRIRAAPPEHVGKTLVNRGCIYWQLGRTELAIADFTQFIDLPGATPRQVAIALVNRGVCYGQAGRAELAIADYTRCIDLPGAPPKQVANAHFNRGELAARDGRTVDAINDARRSLKLQPHSQSEHAAELMQRYASPAFREGWPQLFDALLAALPDGQRDRLEFFAPVAQILTMGEDPHAVLSKLPPEERDFALEVLKKFDITLDPETPPAVPLGFTPAELRIAKLLQTGQTEKAIAETLQLSPSTVHNHVRSIYKKANVHSLAELIQKLPPASGGR